jgi:hypothetical protein
LQQVKEVWVFKEIVSQMTQLRERISQMKVVWTFEKVG